MTIHRRVGGSNSRIKLRAVVAAVVRRWQGNMGMVGTGKTSRSSGTVIWMERHPQTPAWGGSWLLLKLWNRSSVYLLAGQQLQSSASKKAGRQASQALDRPLFSSFSFLLPPKRPIDLRHLFSFASPTHTVHSYFCPVQASRRVTACSCCSLLLKCFTREAKEGNRICWHFAQSTALAGSGFLLAFLVFLRARPWRRPKYRRAAEQLHRRRKGTSTKQYDGIARWTCH